MLKTKFYFFYLVPFKSGVTVDGILDLTIVAATDLDIIIDLVYNEFGNGRWQSKITELLSES